MKKISKIAVVALAAASMMGLGMSSASAGSNGSATPFKAAYDYNSPTAEFYIPGYGAWDCSGARVVNKQGVKDSETCTVTGDFSQWTPWGNFDLTTLGGFWQSDKGDKLVATSATGSMINNGDGTATFNIVAIYPS